MGPQRPFSRQRRFNLQRCLVHRVAQFQAPGMQPQAIETDVFGHSPVQRPFAVGGVAQDRVRDVLHVAAQLMPATGEWLQFQLGPARSGKAT